MRHHHVCGLATLALFATTGFAAGLPEKSPDLHATIFTVDVERSVFTPLDVGLGAEMSIRDLRLWILDRYAEVEIPMPGDLDGAPRDGVVTFIADLIGGLAGDLNGDGAIDAEDINILLSNFGRKDTVLPQHGDVNADGVIDADDLALLTSRVNTGIELELEPNELAELILQDAELAQLEAASGDHFEYFSSTYQPPHFPDGMPDSWPPNHNADASFSWPVFPNYTNPVPGQPHPYYPPGWFTPGNHYVSISNYPPNHFYNTSASWNSHDSTVSAATWPPNHIQSASATWNPPHGTHGITVSRTWNPGHTLDISHTIDPHPEFPMLPAPTPHHGLLSGTWHHNTDISELAWPTNHHGEISRSWPGSHTMNSSIWWPGSHWGGVSQTWPPNVDPTWPPNHFAETSSTWNEPPPPPDPLWFPPGHTIWSTAREIIPLIPVTPSVPKVQSDLNGDVASQ